MKTTELKIPLTEEWLKQLGFYDGYNQPAWEIIIAPGECYVHDDWLFYLKNSNDDEYPGWDFYHERIAFGMPILYVHQLKNLFFVVTGKELTIKESVTT